MELQQKIEELRCFLDLHPDQSFVRWFGDGREEDGGLCGLQMLFLCVMSKHKGKYLARKIAGTSVYIGGASRIVFADNLVRITMTNGKKRVIQPMSLRPDESNYPAGLSKNLEYGHKPFQLHESRNVDSRFVSALHRCMTDNEKVTLGKVGRPIFFILSPEKTDYTPKVHGSLITMLKSSPKFSSDASLDENFQSCFDDCFTKEESGRYIVNYEWVIAKGLPYADMSSVYLSQHIERSIDMLSDDDEYFILKLGGSLPKEDAI